MSLQAGMPSALAFAAHIVSRIQQIDPLYSPSTSGAQLNAVASDLVALAGREALEQLIIEMLSPMEPEPTAFHATAVRRFPIVITTNFDDLLERAADASDSGAPRIVSLHGSVREPSSIALTESDMAAISLATPWQHHWLVEEMQRKHLLVVGSSLRDPAIIALLEGIGAPMQGWSVAPKFTEADSGRLLRWGLQTIEADASSFFAALESALLKSDVARDR